jgi:peroxiredoxin
MALLSIGQLAPGLTLPDLDGRQVCLGEFAGRPVLLNFWSAECPQAARADEAMAAWALPVARLTIASNANEPPEMLRCVAEERGLAPVLIDAGQKAADLYGAQTTPHFFLVDAEGLLRYQGALDDVTFRRRSPTRLFLKEAIEALLAAQPIPEPETPPYGCTIVRY